MPRTQDDDRVMSLVQLALDQPREHRESYIREACTGDTELLTQVMDYVNWEERMRGFLLDPLLPRTPSAYRLQPDELLEGRFRVIRQVAEGGMGFVYEAVDEKLRKRVAIKCAKAGYGTRLFPEVRHACEISHPNVCRTFEIHTASTSGGEIDFVTMEFLDGETLTARLKRGPLPEIEARTIASQICHGLAEAHRHGVVHGDLKSNNVILASSPDGSMRAVITDFGLAHGPVTPQGDSVPFGGSGEVGGTPGYMAPELWKGAKPTTASDVYALGVIFYELATGRRPFVGPAWQPEAALKPPSTHSKWDFVLARCLDPDPAKRFHSAVQIARALEPSRKWRWWLAAAAAVLAAGTWIVAYRRATAPEESIQLAFLPFEANSDAKIEAASLWRETSRELAYLKGGKRARLKVIPPEDVSRFHADSLGSAQSAVGATHILHGRLVKEDGHYVIHALLTDTRTGVNLGSEDFHYDTPELRYAPQALAGMATAGLRLPAIPAARINAAAREDYAKGLEYTRQDSTLDQALERLTRATEADIDSPLIWAALAEAQYFKYHATENKTWQEKAWKSLDEAERRDPDLAPVHRVNGLRFFSSKSFERAEAEYLRSIELGSGALNAQSYWRLGQLYESAKRPEEALIQLKKAVDADPAWFKMYLQLGAFYSSQGDLEQAVEQYKTAVRLAPGEPAAHYNLGTAYSERSNLDEAERELRAALVPGGPVWASNNLGMVLIQKGQDREAIPFLLNSSVNSYRRWMNLGDAYRRTGRLKSARECYKAGLELAGQELDQHPQDGGVRSFFAYLSARLGDKKRAESEITQVLNLPPLDKDTFEIAAWTYVALSEFDRAIDILQKLPDQALAEAIRLPNLADLRTNPRLKELMLSRHIR
jgi:serine/threonine protein kinase/tetratricopeptide (TPR) repeat protein